jgi:hypothetical protein
MAYILTQIGYLQVLASAGLAGSGDLLADGSVPMTADWPFGNFSLFIGDTSNANMTTGLTINQGAADNEIICLKSSDVSHDGYATEVDTFGTLAKQDGDQGGLVVRGWRDATTASSERGALILNATSLGDLGTTKGSGGWKSGIEMWALKSSGGSAANMTANANLISMNTYNARGWVCNWHLDDDGDTWQYGDIKSGEGVKVVRLDLDNSAGNQETEMVGRADRSAEDDEILRIRGYWSANEVCRIDFLAGADTTNKDEGRMKFYVANAGSPGLAVQLLLGLV